MRNISRTKGIQTMKFSQLKEYNIRHIFLENSYTKYSPKPLSEQ